MLLHPLKSLVAIGLKDFRLWICVGVGVNSSGLGVYLCWHYIGRAEDWRHLAETDSLKGDDDLKSFRQ